MRAEDEDLLAGGGMGDLLGDPLGIARRRWPWILAVLALGLVASGAFAYLRKPRYHATAAVMIARQQVSDSIVKPTIEEDTLNRIDAMTAEVLADASLQPIVEAEGLYPELRDVETMSEIVARVRADVTIDPVDQVRPRTREESAAVLEIGFDADRPEQAAGVANALADLFVTASLESGHRQHRLTTEFLRRELARTEQQLRELNGQIAEFKRENRGRLPEDLQPNQTRLDRLQQQRESLALQIAEAETRKVTLTSVDADSPEAQLETLRGDLAEERAIHTERHPTRIALARELAELEQELAAKGEGTGAATSRSALIQATDGTIAVLRSQLTATDAELKDLDERVESTPAVQEELTALEERATILRESYLEFLRKVQDSELAENLLLAQQGERVSVMNRAVPPSLPVKSRWSRLVLGVALSFAAAALAGIVAEALDPVLVTGAQVESAGAYSVIGSVGRIT